VAVVTEREAILGSNSQAPSKGAIQVHNGLNACGHRLSPGMQMTKKVTVKVDVKIDLAKCLWYLALIFLIVVT